MSAVARRVLIVEDLPDTRAWLARVVSEAFGAPEPELAADLRAARHWLTTLAEEDQAPFALVDLGLPDGSGVDFIGELMSRRPLATVVVATIYDDDLHLLAAMAAGAQGYLLKDQDANRLGDRLRALEAGEPAISPPMARRILEHFRRSARFEAGGEADVVLTPRETDVLRLIGRGLTLNEASDVLGVSRHTLPGYVKTIYRKLGVASRAEAAVEAVRRNLV
jgi:DNA-binding NarL/FixJ family response regulator